MLLLPSMGCIDSTEQTFAPLAGAVSVRNKEAHSLVCLVFVPAPLPPLFRCVCENGAVYCLWSKAEKVANAVSPCSHLLPGVT